MQLMLNKIKAMLKPAESSERLTEAKPDQQVSVCAILLEVAWADDDFAPEERETIVGLLREHFGLGAGEVEELIALTEAERARMTDLWPFTHSISRTYSPDEKLELMEMVWQVVFADDKLDDHEDQLVRKLQTMLAVNHSLVIKAKLKARKGQQTEPAEE